MDPLPVGMGCDVTVGDIKDKDFGLQEYSGSSLLYMMLPRNWTRGPLINEISCSLFE